MTAAFCNSIETFAHLRCKARARRIRPVVWAMIWASLAHVSWLAFRLSQERMQPDAIATGLPGFLFRLVIRPFEWAMGSIHGVDPTLLTLQTALVVAICAPTFGLPGQVVRTLGGGRADGNANGDAPLPGRRETTWN